MNTQEIIETAYDLQAGSYIRALDDEWMMAHKIEYGKAIADQIRELTDPTSIIETGVGEGTTLSFVLQHLNAPSVDAHGFDISWSRIACCRQWMQKYWSGNCFLSVASLLHLPYADSCFDVVYTSHTIEPNGGNELAILKELYRVTSRYLILLEPGYELASPEARERMENHGYCTGLVEKAATLGMSVIKHELFGLSANPMNPTALIVIEKFPDAPSATPRLACPNFGDSLEDYGDAFYSPGSLRSYPKIGGIPCLRREDAVIASAYQRMIL
ncbi:class I SAM-dependent methyltransferase [Novipirellula aureliae]|uniref:class I SAM-dependent methyltransferase n=1 Tax=Novipirellula aureliae TaxID=2527966 RepID=UPI0018CD4947|nr:class I SAM-dependent methyltransferase [Novipirellula aureliae]